MQATVEVGGEECEIEFERRGRARDILSGEKGEGGDYAEEGGARAVCGRRVGKLGKTGIRVGLFLVIGEKGVGVDDEILERFEKVPKEILIDKVGVFGQPFEHGTHELGRASFENAEVNHEDQFQGLGLHFVALFAADYCVGFLELFLDHFALLEDFALLLGAEFSFGFELLALDGGCCWNSIDLILRAFRREL